MADSIPQAADALWQVLLHLGRLRSTLPHGETIDHTVHPGPTLPIGATVDTWWEPSAFTRVEIHLNDSPATGNSLLKSMLSVILARLLDPTHADSCYGLLPGGSLYLYPRMPIYDLTIEQTVFWWAQGFFLAIWFLSTHQAPLPLFAPFVHVLLPKRVEDCRLQLDQWSPAAINDIDPMIAGFLRPWLDLKKTQPVSTYPSRTDRLKEPVPVFLMRHCAGIVSASTRSPSISFMLILLPTAQRNRPGIQTRSRPSRQPRPGYPFLPHVRQCQFRVPSRLSCLSQRISPDPRSLLQRRILSRQLGTCNPSRWEHFLKSPPSRPLSNAPLTMLTSLNTSSSIGCSTGNSRTSHNSNRISTTTIMRFSRPNRAK